MPRKNKRFFAFFLRMFLVLVVGGSGAAAVFNLPVWHVQNVEIQGTHLLDPESLRQRIHVTNEDHLLLLRLRPIRKQLERIVQVEHVSIRRKLPSTLLVTITERTPFAVAKIAGESVVIDRHGIVLTPIPAATLAGSWEHFPVVYPDLSSLPIVRQLPPQAVVDGLSLKSEFFSPALTLFSKLSSFLPDRKFQLDMPSSHSLALWIEDVLLVKLGDPEDLENKIAILKTILRHVGNHWQKIEYVDVRYPSHPVYKLRGRE